ncbi:protein of unknown function [Xenorhabdus poinarii G6]|uniref:Uncharacterized protein n=1 Tax=Xenorhabdus poinarii G6 TaxID=1354304 RepID=A0A068R7A7_9GAMM|nr:protein of unknown function [Xenorhabdus poinarii G6]
MTKIKHLSYIYVVIYYLPSFCDEKLILTKNKSYEKVFRKAQNDNILCK